MSKLQQEIDQIKRSEIILGGAYHKRRNPDSLRVVFVLPYRHELSLLCMGPLALYDLINRRHDIPALAERAILYDCLQPTQRGLRVPDGAAYRSIETADPVGAADIVGVSITNAGDLASFFRLLDLAGIPRRSAHRALGQHPLVVGGNAGFANPEPLADYLDAVVLGEGEASMVRLIQITHQARHDRSGKQSLLQRLAQVPGLYVPAMYACELAPGGGVRRIRPRTATVPAKVTPQFLTVEDLHAAHFAAPISDGKRAMIVPTLGCRWACHFCTLGIPPFRQAPFEQLAAYLDRLESHGVAQVIISSPTFTQYTQRYALLDRLRAYAQRSGTQVTTIIGSVRADEISDRYLDAVAELGDFGHLFTELQLDSTRGIITIAPEFASADLVRIFNKTMTPQRVHRAIEMLRDNGAFAHIMLYFIVGAPGETTNDRLAIADYSVAVFNQLGRSDATVIVKLQQFMPKPNTVSQRLAMADPGRTDSHIDQIRDRLIHLVGTTAYQRHYRVLWGESSRLLLESICLRGDRRIGHVLERLHDTEVDLGALSGEQLRTALAAEGLDYQQYLRAFELDEVVPWEVVNTVDRAQEAQLRAAIQLRLAGGESGGSARSPLPLAR